MEIPADSDRRGRRRVSERQLLASVRDSAVSIPLAGSKIAN